MQMMRRLSTTVIWVFAAIFTLMNFKDWTYLSQAYIASRGGRNGGGSDDIFAWVIVGVVFSLALIAQLLAVWIFADKDTDN